MFKQKKSTRFETDSFKWSFLDYFDAFSLVTGDVAVIGDNNTDVTFTNCALFSTWNTETNDLFKQNNSPKVKTESIESSLWAYFDAFFLVKRDITVISDNNTDVPFSNCAAHSTCHPEINDLFKQKNSTKFDTENIKSILWDYFDPFILVKGNVTVIADDNTDVTLTNFERLSPCKTTINNLFQKTVLLNFRKK